MDRIEILEKIEELEQEKESINKEIKRLEGILKKEYKRRKEEGNGI